MKARPAETRAASQSLLLAYGLIILRANPIGAGQIAGIAHGWTAGDALHVDFFEVLGIGDPCLVSSCLTAQQNDAVDGVNRPGFGRGSV